MREAVASQTPFPLHGCSKTDEERRRELEDFGDLIERLLERCDRLDKELRETRLERDALKDENKRLKGE